MSRKQRSLVLVLAVVVLVVGFVIARQAGDDDESTTTAGTVAQTVPAEASEPEGGAGDETGAEAEATEPEAAKPAKPRPPLVEVAGGQPVGGVKELGYDRGDLVDFRVRSDVADEIHVHGYDVEQELPAGEAVRIRFPADIDGRFEVELHESGAQIVELEVQP